VRRPRFVILILLPMFLAATACSSSTSTTAATVAGVDITKSSIDEDLSSINSSDAYRSALEQSYGVQMAGASKGTFSTAFTAQVLSLRVYYQLLEGALVKAGQKVTAADQTAADAAVKQQFAGVSGGADILNGFTKGYRDELIRQQAVVTAARRLVLADAADPETYFNAHKADFSPQTCVSHILVSTQAKSDGTPGLSDAAALAKATDLKKQLDGGADFATLATSSSDDTATNGDLGCHIPGTYVAEFETAMNAATIGKVTDPVKSQYGYHLILVRERRTDPTYDQVKDDVATALDQQSGTALNTLLTTLTCDKATAVKIDSRYGKWDRSECGGTTNGLGKVVAPGGSTTTTQPATSDQTVGGSSTTTTPATTSTTTK
jgi:parvulin-like peptidyl-prolyl isomerase